MLLWSTVHIPLYPWEYDAFKQATSVLRRLTEIPVCRRLISAVMDWIFVFLHNSGVEILNPNVIILGCGASWRWVAHEHGALINGIRALTQRTPESSLPSFPPPIFFFIIGNHIKRMKQGGYWIQRTLTFSSFLILNWCECCALGQWPVVFMCLHFVFYLVIKKCFCPDTLLGTGKCLGTIAPKSLKELTS